jgi:hypothetical protein
MCPYIKQIDKYTGDSPSDHLQLGHRSQDLPPRFCHLQRSEWLYRPEKSLVCSTQHLAPPIAPAVGQVLK